jgi:hypothetical protein
MPPILGAQLNLGDWLKQLAKEKFEISKRGEDVRTQVTVALHRRFRGATLSDRIGRFIPGGTGLWRGDMEGDLDGVDLKCVNVTKPGIKMAMSALNSARVQINNEASNKQPRLRGAANVADGICEWLDENPDHWSDNLESRYNQMIQTGYGAFLHAYHNPKKKADYVETEDWEEQEETVPGEYACTCGAGGTFEADGQEEMPEQVKCPHCGQQAEVLKAPEKTAVPKPGQRGQFNPGDNETAVSSCLEHRVDERNSQGGNLDRAGWFEHHYLTTDEELAEEFPKFQFAAADNAAWSYPIKWKWALETGDDVFSYNYQSDEFRKRRERRDIYLLPQEYSHRIEPEDWELKDGEGKVVFSIKRGERLIDKNPDGFMYSLVGEILAPKWRQVDFRNEWSYGCFVPDAHSFWGQPLVELLQIQDDWNTLYTIDMQHRERNSLNQLMYNREAFDFDDWNHEIVPTAEGWTQPQDKPLSHFYAQLQATPMAEAVSGLQFLFQILPYVGGAPPEAIGADPPGKQGDNYSAQLLRKQSMLGQLQPAGASKAQAKVHHFRNHMRIAQDTWPEERFEYIRTRFGEEWKDDDIQAFLECNFDRDIITDFVEGTEIPTTLIDRIIKIESAIQRYIEAQQQPPEQLLRQWFDLNNIDYDAGRQEADERLADARYQTIKGGLKELAGTLSDQPTVTADPMSGQPVEGPSPLVQAVMSHPQLKVLPKEQHNVSIDFYVARETALMAQPMPDVPLIECLEEMIKRHEMKGVEQGQTETASQIAVQQPAIEAAQAAAPPEEPQADPAQEAQMKADMETQKQEADAKQKSEDRDFQAANDKAQRDHEASMKDKELAHQANLETMRLISSERIAKEAAKQKAKEPAAA